MIDCNFSLKLFSDEISSETSMKLFCQFVLEFSYEDDIGGRRLRGSVVSVAWRWGQGYSPPSIGWNNLCSSPMKFSASARVIPLNAPINYRMHSPMHAPMSVLMQAPRNSPIHTSSNPTIFFLQFSHEVFFKLFCECSDEISCECSCELMELSYAYTKPFGVEGSRLTVIIENRRVTRSP